MVRKADLHHYLAKYERSRAKGSASVMDSVPTTVVGDIENDEDIEVSTHQRGWDEHKEMANWVCC